jgi:hypothetical protein
VWRCSDHCKADASAAQTAACMTSLSTFHAIIWQSNRRAVSALIGRKFAAPSRFLGCTFRARSFVNRSQQYLHHFSQISTPARPLHLPPRLHIPHILELQRSTHPAPPRSIASTTHTQHIYTVTMSWWPFSGAGTDAKAPPQAQSQMPSQAPQPQPQSQATLSGPAPPSPPSHPDTAPHDPDFYAAHPHLAPPSFSTSTTSSSQSNPDSSSNEEYEPLDPHLPHTMSCRAAFDSAFYCSSLGGHFNDIYRQGQLRSCSEHWNDFWFCMRTNNSYNPREVKWRLIQERYREKEQKVKSGPNSEDIWRERGEGERVLGAFGMGKGTGGET